MIQEIRIGELADQTGASTRALRYYEQQGLLESRRQPNGYRDYSSDAVIRVRNIRRLLDAGLSCDDIRELDGCLTRGLDHEPACAEAIALYQQRLDAVRQRVDALLDVRQRLESELDALRPTAVNVSFPAPASPVASPRVRPREAVTVQSILGRRGQT